MYPIYPDEDALWSSNPTLRMTLLTARYRTLIPTFYSKENANPSCSHALLKKNLEFVHLIYEKIFYFASPFISCLYQEKKYIITSRTNLAHWFGPALVEALVLAELKLALAVVWRSGLDICGVLHPTIPGSWGDLVAKVGQPLQPRSHRDVWKKKRHGTLELHILWNLKCYSTTDPFTTLEQQNPSHDALKFLWNSPISWCWGSKLLKGPVGS